MRSRAHCLLITLVIAGAPTVGAGLTAHAQAIGPMQPPSPIGRQHKEHSREWYVQNGYHWNGRKWEMPPRERGVEPQPAATIAPTPARAQAETPPPQPQQR